MSYESKKERKKNPNNGCDTLRLALLLVDVVRDLLHGGPGLSDASVVLMLWRGVLLQFREQKDVARDSLHGHDQEAIQRLLLHVRVLMTHLRRAERAHAHGKGRTFRNSRNF